MNKVGERAENWLNAHTSLLAVAIVLCGLIWRLHRAASFYLNPDEAFSYVLAARQDWHGLWGFYQNAVKSAHPPFLILVLRGVLRIGHSELALRLASVLAGASFPWLVMLWVRQLAGSAASLCALLLLTFSPTLIGLSAEVRPYALAFLFMSASTRAGPRKCALDDLVPPVSLSCNPDRLFHRMVRWRGGCLRPVAPLVPADAYQCQGLLGGGTGRRSRTVLVFVNYRGSAIALPYISRLVAGSLPTSRRAFGDLRLQRISAAV